MGSCLASDWMFKKNIVISVENTTAVGLAHGKISNRNWLCNWYFKQVLQNFQLEIKKLEDVNGSQLAKMKKSIPDMSPSWNL